MKINPIIISFISILLLASCAIDEQCRQNKTVQLGATFYHITKNQTTGAINRTSLAIDSITIAGLMYDTVTNKYIKSDSVIYNKSKAKSNIYLPLHKFENASKYEVVFNNVIDTLTVLHTNINQYLSLECGCMIVHSIDTVLMTNNFKIDSIRIINHDVKTENAENIRIYK